MVTSVVICTFSTLSALSLGHDFVGSILKRMTLAVLKNEYSIPTFTFAALIVQISDLFLYNSPIDINVCYFNTS